MSNSNLEVHWRGFVHGNVHIGDVWDKVARVYTSEHVVSIEAPCYPRSRAMGDWKQISDWKKVGNRYQANFRH